MRGLFSAILVSSLGIFACTPKPPVQWDSGGAPLVIQPARWDRPKDDPIEIQADGKVLDDGDLLFTLDRVGRVTDDDYEPLAVLLPDGYVAGTDNHLLGRVGVANASPPGSAAAWLAILPSGQVIQFDEEGDRYNAGTWHGCEGPQKRTCTLVTHMSWVRQYMNRSNTSVGVGIGVMY